MVFAKRGQLAMESLTTYVFAVLALIGVVVVVVVIDPTNIFEEQDSCTFTDGLGCASFSFSQIDNETFYFDVQLQNPSSTTYNVQALEIKTQDATNFCLSSAISTLTGDATDGKVFNQGGSRTVRFIFNESAECSFNASGITFADGTTRFDAQLLYTESGSVYSQVSRGTVTASIVAPDDIELSGTCAPAAVTCGDHCVYGLDGGLGGCFFDDACFYACNALEPGEEVHRIQLQTGDNLVSTYLVPSDPSFSEIFAPLIGNGLVSVRDEQGDIIFPGTNPDWNIQEGYLITMSAPAELFIIGTPGPTSFSLDLQSGTNYIAVPRGRTENVFESVLPLLNQQVLLEVRDGQGNVISAANAWEDTIGALQEGRAYEIILATDAPSSLTWPQDYEAYQIVELHTGTNYITPGLMVEQEASELFLPLYEDAAVVTDIYSIENPGRDLRASTGWTDNYGVVNFQDYLVLEMTAPATFAFTGQEGPEVMEHIYRGSENTSYIGIPDITPMDAFRVLQPFIEPDFLHTATDSLGNQVYFNSSLGIWVNEIGNFTPGNFYVLEHDTGFVEQILVNENNDCLFESTCQSICGEDMGFGRNDGTCYSNSFCTTQCIPCLVDAACAGACGTGYSRGGGTCYTDASCETTCVTCNPDPTCCRGTGGYSEFGSCYTDSLCSESICTYTQEIRIEQQYDDYFSIYLEPSTTDTFEFFQDVFEGELVFYLEDSYGNQLYSDGSVAPGPRSTMDGEEILTLRLYEGYMFNARSTFDFVVSGPEMGPEHSLTESHSYYFPLADTYLVGIPQSLSTYDAPRIFADLRDAGSLVSVTDSDGRTYSYDGWIRDWVDEISPLTPGEAYQVRLSEEGFTLDFTPFITSE